MENDINREISIEHIDHTINIQEENYTIEINPQSIFEIQLNEQGPQGARGYTGNGIESYVKTSSSGLTDTYTITFTDGNTTTVNVTNGRSITSITGPVSVGNVDTYTINYNDSTTSTFTVTNGIDGVSPTVTVGSTTTGNPGTNASVVNSGTVQDVVLDFTIPRGDKGETGEDGNDGFSPIATVSKVGDTATISITDVNGTTTATITDGTDGQAATISIGTVTTGLPTDPASVTNVGTSSAAVFDFTIPKGEKGDTGNGIASISLISTVGLQKTYRITYTDGTYYDYVVMDGASGSTTWGGISGTLSNQTDLNNVLIDLQDQIDAIVSSSDVFDIVGTYAELQAYDISTVPVNDIIKVLVDSTHGDAATYYRCTETGGIKSWVYIGSEGAYYTKGEADNKFALKTSIPTKTSDLTNDSNFATTSQIPTNNNQLINGAGYITGITSSDIATALGYTPQEELVSGTNIKTINGNSILGSGNLNTPFRNIGEIVPSTIPLTDASLHLLDGALINGSGIYSAFVTYIAGLITDYPDLFVTEAQWQTSVSTYGVCGKFVYNSENNTVRLPKITGIIEGTTDLTALGDLVEAGLPNITGTITQIAGTGAYTSSTGFVTLTGPTAQPMYGSNSSTRNYNVSFNATNSNAIYGNSSTVQPQTIKVLYYIVIATTIKTDIQVDIDEVTTDLNGKADTDLTNCTDVANIKMAHNAMPSTVYTELTLGASGTSYTAPADGYFYVHGAGTANGDYRLTSGRRYQNATTPNVVNFSVLFPVCKGQAVTYTYSSTYNNSNKIYFFYAQGSESEAQ